MGILREGESVMRARQRGLEVAKDDVQPLEWLNVAARFAFGRNDNLVREADLAQHLESQQSIGGDGGPRNQGFARPISQSRIRESRDWIEAYTLRSFIHHFHRRHEGHLVLRSSTGFAACPLSTQVGIINAHVARQRLRGFALTHGFHQLVVQQPGGLPGDANLAAQSQRGNLHLGLGHQIDGQEPLGQRQPGVLHQPARGQRGLPAAAAALPVDQPVAPKLGRMHTPAFRAVKARRPACLYQCGLALGIRAVLLHKLRQGQTFLKLDQVDRHDHAPRVEHSAIFVPVLSHQVSLAEVGT